MSQEPIPVVALEMMYRACVLGLELEAARWLEARACGRVSEAQDNALSGAIQEVRKAERRLRGARKREERAA